MFYFLKKLFIETKDKALLTFRKPLIPIKYKQVKQNCSIQYEICHLKYFNIQQFTPLPRNLSSKC